MSAPSRSFPDFFVLGAPKAGTTALCEFLQGHPRVAMSAPKEPRFFNLHFSKGPEWYRQSFLSTARGQICGDGTPSYLANPTALQRIAQTAPDARLFVLLRDPAARAISSWWMRVSQGREHLGFQAALRVSLQEPDLNEVFASADGPIPYRGYLHYGLYGRQMQLLKSLFPVEQIHLIWSRELLEDPARVVARVLESLGLEPGLRKGNLRPRWQALGVRTVLIRNSLMQVCPELANSRRFHQFATLMRLMGDRPVRPGAHLYRFLLEYFEPSDRMLEEQVGEKPPWR